MTPRTLAAGLAGALIFAAGVQAFAADLPPAPPPPPRAPATYVPPAPPVYNWGGIYVGINGGGAFGTSNWSDPNNPALDGSGSTGDFDTSGWLVGGTLGFNFQADQLVFGLEADVDYSTITGTVTPSNLFCTNVNAAGAISTSCQTANNWLGTVRGRIGFAVDRVLLFATGGLAFGNVQAGLANGGISTVTYDSNTELGWTAGAGVEFALGENWTAKVEYLYVDLGSNATCTSAANCGTDFLPTFGSPADDSVKFTANVVRAGFNFKFSP
jgi:outer membrane immunogenic protein